MGRMNRVTVAMSFDGCGCAACEVRALTLAALRIAQQIARTVDGDDLAMMDPVGEA